MVQKGDLLTDIGISTGTFVYAYDSEKKIVERYGDDIYLTVEVGTVLKNADDIERYKEANGNGLLLYRNAQALGYRKDNGQIVTFHWPGGSFRTGLGFYVYDISKDTKSLVASYEETVASADDPSGVFLEQGDKELYEDIMSNYVPFMFRTINEDNINKYIVQDYKNSGLYTYTDEECKAFYATESAIN